ncbi:SDR family NAD(P)-dependent oxidoreductase [Variovorax defluvii]|uniref:SDR family NAD(P)-dependent oxidoreductase n=1 Tax=Variovorax defluvii TaxID=913761 RepID=A0ABP8HF16_9BURK
MSAGQHIGGRLAGKAGIVVGAGQSAGESAGATVGNGRAAALLFARAGARLLLVDRSEAAAQATAELLRAEGHEAHALAGDWTRPGDCEVFADACLTRWGRIDLLHNNVGILSREPEPSSTTVEELERVMKVNLAGCVNACQAVLPAMREQGAGSIVNISSVAAVAATGQLAYALSKAALNGLGRELALLNARHGVRVNTVSPGLMDTPMAIGHKSRVHALDPALLRAQRDALVPLAGGMGTGWDTAWASLYLHSDEARFVTGVVLPVDGGQSALVGGLLQPAQAHPA